MATKAPKQCVGCGKFISYKGFSTHQKSCKEYQELPSEKELVETYRNTKYFRDKIIELEQKLLEANSTISKLKTNITNNTNNTNCNNITNNNINNNYYVMNFNTGEKNGLDLDKINSFGHENTAYIDKNKSLEYNLKELYCNDDHPENRIISHCYLNLEWLVIKLTNNRVLRYHINSETMHICRDFIIKRVEEICENTYNIEDKNRAIKSLISKLTDEVKTKNLKEHELPIWNKEQYNKCDNDEWLTHFTKDNLYWQKVKIGERRNQVY